MNEILKLMAGPVIGSLIGYCTNFIAVKMLFFPKRELKLFGLTLPFTPGVIPKSKARIAKAVGKTVGCTLITAKDLADRLNSQVITSCIDSKVCEAVNTQTGTLVTDFTGFNESLHDMYREKTADVITSSLLSQVSKLDIASIITTKGSEIIREKVQGTMLQMFVNDSLIASLTGPVGKEIDSYISENGSSLVKPLVIQKLNEIERETPCELLSRFDISQSVLTSMISSFIKKEIASVSETIISKIDISSIVEEKINMMSVDELEEMVLSVMKKELSAIVNLGALIGFVLGLLNIILR